MDPETEGAQTSTTTTAPASATPAAPPPAAPPPVVQAAALPTPEAPKPEGRIELTKEDLDSRLSRAKRTALKESIGEEDPAVVKAKLERLAALEADGEAKRIAALSEAERTKEELARANARAETAEKALKEQRRSNIVARETQRVTGIAVKHIAPEATGYALADFSKHLKSLSRADANKLTDKDVEVFFRDLAKKKPFMAKSTAPAAPAAPKVPVTTGTVAARKPGTQPSGTPSGEKTARPGQPNSMSKAEINKAYGIRMP